MRRLKILEYAISSLWRRRYKNLSIIVVYTFTISVLASILLLTHSLRVEAFHILRDAPDVVVQRLAAGRHDLIPTSMIESMRGTPGRRGREGEILGVLLRRAHGRQLHPPRARRRHALESRSAGGIAPREPAGMRDRFRRLEGEAGGDR